MNPEINELILSLVQSLDEKADKLSDGQASIKTQLATHEERSLAQHRRIKLLEKATGAVATIVLAAVLTAFFTNGGL